MACRESEETGACDVRAISQKTRGIVAVESSMEEEKERRRKSLFRFEQPLPCSPRAAACEVVSDETRSLVRRLVRRGRGGRDLSETGN